MSFPPVSSLFTTDSRVCAQGPEDREQKTWSRTALAGGLQSGVMATRPRLERAAIPIRPGASTLGHARVHVSLEKVTSASAEVPMRRARRLQSHTMAHQEELATTHHHQTVQAHCFFFLFFFSLFSLLRTSLTLCRSQRRLVRPSPRIDYLITPYVRDEMQRR